MMRTMIEPAYFNEPITFSLVYKTEITDLDFVSLAELRKLPSIPAIYFAVSKNNELLYIGKAESLKSRWKNHHRYEQLVNDYPGTRIYYHKINDKAHLKILEEYFIELFSPKLNSQPIPRYKKLSEWTEFVAEVPSRINRGQRTTTSGYDFGCHRDEECSAYGLYGDWIIDILAEKLRWYNYRFESENNDGSKLWLKIEPQLYHRLAISTFEEAQFVNSVIQRLYKDGFIRMREEEGMVEITLRVKEEKRQEWN